MELTGLTLGQFLGVLAAAGAAVTALYMLKLRRRTVVVPFVMLWDKLLADKHATSLFSRLRRLLSLLLALLLVGLLALSLADPRHAETSDALRHTVILIDAGITMQTREGNNDRLQIAIDEARHLIEAMGSKDRILVAQLDSTATPLSPMTNEATPLLSALSRIVATDVTTNIAAGVELAEDMLRASSQPEIVIISDGAGGPQTAASDKDARDSKIPLRHVMVGKATRDVGISAFAVRRFPIDKTRSELLVELHNTGDDKAAFELRLSGDGKAIDVQPIELAPAERKRLVYDNITGVDRTLQATLHFADDTHNALKANDTAFATLPERTRMRVLCVTTGNRYLEAALLLDEYLQVDVVDPSAYAESADHDVVIFDRAMPATPPTAPAIYLAPAEGITNLGPLRVSGTLDRPYFDRTQAEHPLLRHLSLRDVNMVTALSVATERTDTVVGADARGPLLVVGSRNAVPFVALAFDVTQSDLPLRVAWPMLLLNALDGFAREQVGYVDNYRAGERGLLTLGERDAVTTWTSPKGDTLPLPVADGRAVIDVSRAGLYTLRLGETDKPIAVNPTAIKTIAPHQLTASVVKAGASKVAAPITREQPWTYLLLLVIAMLAIEWFTFHRRWTV